MPDNVTAPAVGIAFATDEIAGVHWPFAKLAFGAADAALRVADAEGFRLPVSLGGSLPGFAATPTFNLGSAPTLAVTGPLTDAQLRAAALPVAFTGQSVGITGSVAITAAALPLPAGAATSAAQGSGNASLANIDAKLAALEAGRMPVAVQALANGTRAYDFAGGQRLTTAGPGQVRSAAVAAGEVLLHASVRGFFRVGDAAVAASVGPGSIPLAAEEKFHLRLTAGQFISFVRDGASDGSLTIMPVAA
jgi:hypothetical protein